MRGLALAGVKKFFPEVTTVVDAKKDVSIEVTPQDCKSGSAKNNKECALAKACKRQLNISGVMINMGFSYLITGKKAHRYKTPERVARELISFDRHKDFTIGMYKLKAPTGVSKLGSRVHEKNPKGRNTGERRKVQILHFTSGVRYLRKYRTEK